MSTKDHLSCILQTYKKLFDAFDIRLNPREEFKIHKKLHKSLRIVSVLVTPELTQRRREVKAALMKESKRIKYGNPNYNNRESAEATCLKKYGVKNPSGADFVKEKKKNTCIKNFGVDNPLKSEKIRARAKHTNFEKYGVEYTSQAPHFKKMVGEKWAAKSKGDVEFIVEKRNSTISNIPNYFKNRQLKIEENNLKKYGVKSPNQIFIKNYNNLNRDFIIENFTNGKTFKAEEFCSYFNIQPAAACRYKMKMNLKMFSTPKNSNISKSEINFLEELEKSKNIKIDRQVEVFPDSRKRVDGLCENVVYEYLGDIFHGRGKTTEKLWFGLSEEEAFAETEKRFYEIIKLGYRLFYIWDSDYRKNGLASMREFNPKIGLET